MIGKLMNNAELLEDMICNPKNYKKKYMAERLSALRYENTELEMRILRLKGELDEIKSEKNKVAETQAEQTQEVSFQTQSITVTTPKYPSSITRSGSEDSTGGELVEQRTSGNIQEVESSLHGLRSPCERG